MRAACSMVLLTPGVLFKRPTTSFWWIAQNSSKDLPKSDLSTEVLLPSKIFSYSDTDKVFEALAMASPTKSKELEPVKQPEYAWWQTQIQTYQSQSPTEEVDIWKNHVMQLQAWFLEKKPLNKSTLNKEKHRKKSTLNKEKIFKGFWKARDQPGTI